MAFSLVHDISYIKKHLTLQMYREKLGHEVWLDLHALVHFGEPLAPLLDVLTRSYPCLECRNHLRAHLDHGIRPLEGNEQHWLVDLHNVVNKDLGKPIKTYDFCALYDGYAARAQRLRSLSSYKIRLDALHRAFQTLTIPSLQKIS